MIGSGDINNFGRKISTKLLNKEYIVTLIEGSNAVENPIKNSNKFQSKNIGSWETHEIICIIHNVHITYSKIS